MFGCYDIDVHFTQQVSLHMTCALIIDREANLWGVKKKVTLDQQTNWEKNMDKFGRNVNDDVMSIELKLAKVHREKNYFLSYLACVQNSNGDLFIDESSLLCKFAIKMMILFL